MSSILAKASFCILDETDQKKVRQFFDRAYQGKILNWDDLEIFRHRKLLASHLQYYSSRLKEINVAAFPFKTKEQRTVLLQELLFTFYLLSAQVHLDAIEDQKEDLKKKIEQIQRCANLIFALRNIKKQSPESRHASLMEDSEKTVKYLELTLVSPFITQTLEELSTGKTGVLKNWCDEINGQRAYWVRGNAVLANLLNILPENFLWKREGEKILKMPAPVFSYLSWIIYYIRFGIHLGLLLKHTLPGSWMSDAEKQFPIKERFKNQWEIRRFHLLNDGIWANINVLCFFWITGTQFLGYAANAISLTFMALDIVLACWHYCIENSNYYKELGEIEQDITILQDKIELLPDTNQHKKILQEQQLSLLKSKRQIELNWKYKSYSLLNDIVYVVGLFIAFSLTSIFLVPPTLLPNNIMMFSLVGAIVCFAVTIAYSAVTHSLLLQKAKEMRDEAQQELSDFLDVFDLMENELQKKQLFLDIQFLKEKLQHQQQLLHFQKIILAFSVIENILLPVFAFTSLVFMPFAMGVAVLAAGLFLVKIAESSLNRLKPEEATLPDFQEEEYEEFESSRKIPLNSSAEQTFGSRFKFFQPNLSPSPRGTELPINTLCIK